MNYFLITLDIIKVNMSSKRKRGCNYTAEETNIFLDLVQQYQSAVEDKRTGSAFLARKKEAWEKICSAYNEIQTSGIRTVEQLKNLYDNKKQRARKSLAECNGQWSRTGGGVWCPTISENDQKILAIIKDQAVSLPNSCDSAAQDFKDTSEEMIINVPLHNLESEESLSCSSNVEVSIVECPHLTKASETLDNPGFSQDEIKKHEGNLKSEINEGKVASKTPIKHAFGELVNYKELYFKRKCQNANLQKRKILQDMRLRQQEYLMFKKEHKLKLAILQKEYDEKFK